MTTQRNTSLAKIEANRRNALRSTGPRSAEGKAIVHHNALKHGLLAREVIITRGDGREDPRDFQGLQARLRSELQPVGVLEEMLVEKIAVSYWRLRRSLRAEAGEIRRRLDHTSWDFTFQMADTFTRDKRFLMTQEVRARFERSSMGIYHMLKVLTEVREEVEQVGHLPEYALGRLIKTFGSEHEGLAETCSRFSSMVTEGPRLALEDPEHFKETPNPEGCKNALLYLLDEKRKELELVQEPSQEREMLELDTMTRSRALPEADAMDKILRYETAIERQLYRALNQLERLQRQRHGELLPAPASVTVS